MLGLAIFAGRGVLPQELAIRRPDALVVSFRGIGLDFVPTNGFEAEFEKSGKLFRKLRKGGIGEICFAGSMSRPEFSAWRMDFKTWRLMPKLKSALAESDGNALLFIRKVVESEGFSVVGAHEIAPEMAADLGVMGAIAPTTTDFARAKDIHRTMSALDIGQALIMRGGQCLAVETLPGTQAMMEFAALQAGQGGYLYKASKDGQDLAMDMASIGPDTISQAANAKLEGIVLGAGRTLILSRKAVIDAANAANIFLVGV